MEKLILVFGVIPLQQQQIPKPPTQKNKQHTQTMSTLPILDVSTRSTESLTAFRPAWCRNARTRRNHRSKSHYKEDGVQYSGFKFEPAVVELQVGDAIVQEGAPHGTAPYVVEGRTRKHKLVLSRMHRGEKVVTRDGDQIIQNLPEEKVFYTIPFDGVVTQYATETFYIPIDFLYNETAVVEGMTRDGKYRIFYNGNVYHTNRNVSHEAQIGRASCRERVLLEV